MTVTWPNVLEIAQARRRPARTVTARQARSGSVTVTVALVPGRGGGFQVRRT